MSNISEAQGLLVEDNPNDVELILRALGKHGLAQRIQVVRDGAEALDYLFAEGAFANRPRPRQLSVIFLDLKLPKVSGLEVLQQIKSDERTRLIPVVILTSSMEDSDLHQSYRSGANSYMVKPVDYEQFVQSVGTLGKYWLGLNEISR